MKAVMLVDTRQAIAGESIGTVVSTHDIILAAFKANDEFQSRMRASGVDSYVRTQIVILKARLRPGEHVKPVLHFFWRAKNTDGPREDLYATPL